MGARELRLSAQLDDQSTYTGATKIATKQIRVIFNRYRTLECSGALLLTSCLGLDILDRVDSKQTCVQLGV